MIHRYSMHDTCIEYICHVSYTQLHCAIHSLLSKSIVIIHQRNAIFYLQSSIDLLEFGHAVLINNERKGNEMNIHETILLANRQCRIIAEAQNRRDDMLDDGFNPDDVQYIDMAIGQMLCNRGVTDAEYSESMLASSQSDNSMTRYVCALLSEFYAAG